MSRMLRVLVLTLAVTFTFTSAGAPKGVDIQQAGSDIIEAIHAMSNQAKRGDNIDKLKEHALQLEDVATQLLDEFPGKVSDCESQLIIKMAAQKTGSHEVLTVLLAKDQLSVLNGRLSMALAYLEEVADLMEDELALDADVAPHLKAIIFGTGVTKDIIDTADGTIKAIQKTKGGARERRFLELGNGWKVGGNGIEWTSRNGRFSAHAKPTFSGFKPNGFNAGLTFRF